MSCQVMNCVDKAHLTAITRKRPSAPMAYLHSKALLKGDVLDYGCGKGYDVRHFNIDGYDPHYAPYRKEYKQYDVVTCNYVLNILKIGAEYGIIKEICQRLLKHSGIAYITVRNDIKEDGYTSTGTYQRRVTLPYPIEKKTAGYVMYKIVKKEGMLCD